MTRLTSTNAQYYLIVGQLQDTIFFSVNNALQRDMVALTEDVSSTTDRWGTKGDVHHLASLVLRVFERAGVPVLDALGSEEDYNPDVDKAQVIKDLFVLHGAIQEFVRSTWHGEPAQQSSMDELLGKALAAAAHSRMRLRDRMYKRALATA